MSESREELLRRKEESGRRLSETFAKYFTPEERKAIAADLKAQIPEMARDIGNAMGHLLQQEYKQLNGRWALFSLGKFARWLTDEEISEMTSR